MYFEIISAMEAVELIASSSAIREIRRLRKTHEKARWRKLKGRAVVRLADGKMHKAEIHWYEAHGIGKREFKIKRILD